MRAFRSMFTRLRGIRIPFTVRATLAYATEGNSALTNADLKSRSSRSEENVIRLASRVLRSRIPADAAY